LLARADCRREIIGEAGARSHPSALARVQPYQRTSIQPRTTFPRAIITPTCCARVASRSST
jgi:hypothetical protein